MGMKTYFSCKKCKKLVETGTECDFCKRSTLKYYPKEKTPITEDYVIGLRQKLASKFENKVIDLTTQRKTKDYTINYNDDEVPIKGFVCAHCGHTERSAKLNSHKKIKYCLLESCLKSRSSFQHKKNREKLSR